MTCVFVLCLSLLGAVASQHVRTLGAVPATPEGLEQILGDGQPEDIGYGFQRALVTSRNIRNSRPEGVTLLEPSSSSSVFRERLASRQRRQRSQLPQQPEAQRQQQQWGDWRRENPSVASFYPAAGPSASIDNPERYLQALREAWARYQQQTGAIDIGPDDLTDLETLQFLEALGEDMTGTTRKRSSGGGAGSAGWDWAAPLAWTPLKKRSAPASFQDDSGEWSDEAAVAPDEAEPEDVVPAVAGSRLAMLLSQQLFDERYNDPAVKRLLLAKRSLPRQAQQTAQQAARPAEAAEASHEVAAPLPGLQGRAMRRRKKSARPALQATAAQESHSREAGSVQKDLARIFGEPDSDGEPEEPLALPLAAAATDSPAATAAPASARNATGPAPSPPMPMNPIGHAHETDKLAREHHQHATSTASPNVVVKVHGAEHAPPMVSAEGPHGHDQAVHAEDKKHDTTEQPKEKPGSPAGVGGALGRMGLNDEDPVALEQSKPRRLAKKSIDWSQYFGIDRRRKKSLSANDVDASHSQINPEWLQRVTLRSFRAGFPKTSNIMKRVAIKREGASPDTLLLGRWTARQDWDGGAREDDDDDAEDGVLGRCPAVTRLAESCRGAVGANDGLLPLCVLYQACHLCSAAMGVPVGSSCEAELARRGADLCAATPSAGREEECRVAVEAIVQVYRSRQPDNETCMKQPCLAHFFLTAPVVAFAR